MGKTALVYYSCTGTTERVARLAAAQTGAELFEIVPQKPYTKVSSYTRGIIDGKSGKLIELADIPDISAFDTVIIGFPIWAWTAPAPIISFIERTDLSGKRVMAFCTDGGNKGKAFDVIESKTPSSEHIEGCEFSFVKKLSDDELKDKIKSGFKALL